jgi:hypothetical protein
MKYGNYVTRFSFPVLQMPATQQKFLERMKDDFIVREPRAGLQDFAAVKPTSAPVETSPPKPREKLQVHLVPEESDRKLPPPEEQTVFPFHPEL